MKNNAENGNGGPKDFRNMSKITKKFFEELARWISIRGTGRLRANLGLFFVSLVISLMVWAFVAWEGTRCSTIPERSR